MLHIENIRVGDYVTPIRDLEDETVPENPFWQTRKAAFDGRPYEVLAVSFPFVALQNGGKVMSIDIRRFELTKLTKQYANATMQQNGGATTVKRGKKRKIRTKRDPRDCVRCGQRMVQRIPKESNPARLWHRVCPDCGFDCGPVEKP